MPDDAYNASVVVTCTTFYAGVHPYNHGHLYGTVKVLSVGCH